MDADVLLTPRDAQALLGLTVERLEPSSEDRRRASFVCFGARGSRPAIVCEMLSLASAPAGRPADVPFVSVAVSTDRSAPNPRRTVSARWEQGGLKFALTYTCVAAADDDEVADAATGKRSAIAALARVVSERLSALPSGV